MLRSLYYRSGLALLVTVITIMPCYVSAGYNGYGWPGGYKVKVGNNTEFDVVVRLINEPIIRNATTWINPKGRKNPHEMDFSFKNDDTLTEINAYVESNGKGSQTPAQGWKGTIKGSDANFVVEAIPGTSNNYRIVQQ